MSEQDETGAMSAQDENAALNPEHIAGLRAEVDAVDDAILGLLAERLRLARALGHAKGGTPGAPDYAREQAILDRLLARELVPEAAIAAVWATLFVVAREAQATDIKG